MRTIVSVQLLRAVAALAVTLCHFDELNAWLAGLKDPYPLNQLSCGVDLFFVISGFVMVVSSADLFATKDGARIFIGRRLARIVPPYWLATAVAIPLMSLPVDWASLLGSYFFIPYRVANGNINPLLGVGWTLNFEMFFYVLFSAVIFLRREIAVLALGLMLLAAVAAGRWLKPELAPLQFWSDPIILEFAAGAILGLCYFRRVRLPSLLRIGLVIGGLITLSLFDGRMPPSGSRLIHWGTAAAMIVAGAVLGSDITFGRLRGAIIVLGDSSYALYLIHTLMTAVILLAWPAGLNQYPPFAVLFAGVVAAQVIAIATFHFFERRTTRLMQRGISAMPQLLRLTQAMAASSIRRHDRATISAHAFRPHDAGRRDGGHGRCGQSGSGGAADKAATRNEHRLPPGQNAAPAYNGGRNQRKPYSGL